MSVLDNIERAIEDSKRLTSKVTSLDALYSMATNCKGCELSIDRTNTVFSRGNKDSDTMVVGMAPAKEEDRTGIPFVGKSGKFLNLLLEEAFLTDVYITNIVKCYLKPGLPIKKKCSEACSYFLEKQIDLVAPKKIIALGKYSTICLYSIFGEKYLSNLKLKDLQGTCREYGCIKVYSTYHPQYLARFGRKGTKYYSRTLKLLKEVYAS